MITTEILYRSNFLLSNPGLQKYHLFKIETNISYERMYKKCIIN